MTFFLSAVVVAGCGGGDDGGGGNTGGKPKAESRATPETLAQLRRCETKLTKRSVFNQTETELVWIPVVDGEYAYKGEISVYPSEAEAKARQAQPLDVPGARYIQKGNVLARSIPLTRSFPKSRAKARKLVALAPGFERGFVACVDQLAG
jgi:hypothetical protein